MKHNINNMKRALSIIQKYFNGCRELVVTELIMNDSDGATFYAKFTDEDGEKCVVLEGDIYHISKAKVSMEVDTLTEQEYKEMIADDGGEDKYNLGK